MLHTRSKTHIVEKTLSGLLHRVIGLNQCMLKYTEEHMEMVMVMVVVMVMVEKEEEEVVVTINTTQHNTHTHTHTHTIYLLSMELVYGYYIPKYHLLLSLQSIG